MSFWITQLTLLVLVSAVFALLLKTYRQQTAMEESFLCSMLLMCAGCVTPDALLFFPVVWWAFVVLWSNNLRMYMASMCGIMLVVLYAVLVLFLWPESIVVASVRSQLTESLSRQLLTFDSSPLTIWRIVTAGIAMFIGLCAMIAHLSRFARANVRVQSRVLISIPFLLLSILSCLFPTASGNCLLAILVAAAVYLSILYLASYGIPRVRFPRKERRRHRRFSRR